MFHLNEMLYYMSDEYWDKLGDPRINNWWLFKGGIWRMIPLLFGYYLLTRSILPRVMKNRPAYNLKKVIVVYNTFMALSNMFFFYVIITHLDVLARILSDFNFPSRDDYSPKIMYLLHMGYYCYFTRILDLLDTVFFVLRKKESQITPLHLYHHMIVPFLGWFTMKYNGVIGIFGLFLIFNTFIHAIMYTYYALSSFGPSIQKYLWWKKYITIIQIIQFAVCGIYGVVLYFKQTGYPMEWFVVCVGQNAIFLVLFIDFYQKSYQNKCKLKSNQ